MVYSKASSSNTTQSYKEFERDLNTYLRRTNGNTTDAKRDKNS